MDCFFWSFSLCVLIRLSTVYGYEETKYFKRNQLNITCKKSGSDHVFCFIFLMLYKIVANFFNFLRNFNLFSTNLQSCGCRLAIFVNKQNNKI